MSEVLTRITRALPGAKWARHPPSDARVKLVLAVIAVAPAICGLERIFGTPARMQLEEAPRGRINR